MANPSPTLRQVLHNCAPEDEIIINGVKLRVENFLHLLLLTNDPRLSEICIEAANGTFALYNASTFVADSTSPALKAQTKKHR